ncbi:MAG: pyridoxal phosphate-dependent decarboxylase family protein [Actinomycetota bacterium]
MSRFDWHREPELIDFRDPTEARSALERLGEDTWREALEWLYGEALQHPTSAERYPDLRREFYGEGGRPGPAPSDGEPSAAVLKEFRERIAPHTLNAQHPGAYSFFTPPPLPIAIAAEVLAAWTNQGIDLWLSGMVGPFVEEEVVTWLRDAAGYDERGWGVLTSGGVMANLMGLTVARDVHLAKLLGLAEPPRGGALEGVRAYASDQAHFSIERALDMLGFPRETLRVLPSDDAFHLRPDTVANAVAEDRAAGLLPWAICPVAGSTNTGAIDPLNELAALAERERLWNHVDAAYGGAALLSEREAHRLRGAERADSMTIDPHKWFFQPYDIGGLLVKERRHLLDTFHRSPEYYRDVLPEDEPLHWYQYSIEGTRRFRALKLWLSWKHLGTHGFARLIEHNIDLARHLAERCRREGFEVIEPELSVVCFRLVPPSSSEADADAHQNALQRALEESGDGWLSTTTLRGRTYLRAGVVNYLSTHEDADRLVDALLRFSVPGSA